MALFKICRGNEANLPTALNDGWAYFCTDTGNFYIDYTNSSSVLVRKHINSNFSNGVHYLDGEEYVEISAEEIAGYGNAIENLNQLVGDSSVADQISTALEGFTVDGAGAYVQPDEPTDAKDGTLWVDTDEEAETSLNVSTPDWNQNDSTASDYIKNRTHWEDSGHSIDWDGNTEGLDSIILDSGLSLYKISDLTPTINELTDSISATMITETTKELTSDLIIDGTNCINFGYAIIAYSTEVAMNGITVSLPSTGVYAANIPITNIDADIAIERFASLTYGSTTIEWDGSTNGKDSADDGQITMYKISDLTPTAEEVLGGMLVSEQIISNKLSSEFISVGTDCISVSNMIIIMHNTEAFIFDTTLSAPSTGVYVMIDKTDSSTVYISNLSYGSTTIHKLDEKYLPDTVATKEYVDTKVSAVIPAYTEDDYGKFLTPSSDGLVWYSMPNAEEASF